MNLFGSKRKFTLLSNPFPSITIMLLALVIAGTLHGCGRQKSAPEESFVSQGKKSRNMSSDAKTTSDEGNGNELMWMQMPTAKGRLLEYRINLTLKSEDLVQARKQVLAFAQEYGFLIKSYIQRQTTDPYIDATVYIEKKRMFAAMTELNDLGTIVTEKIMVRDHTKSMKWQQIQAELAQQQVDRRKSRQGSKEKWKGEKLLSQSEKSQAKARYEQWQLKDKVKWAKVDLRIEGTKQIRPIEVPSFGDALNRALELLLYTVYILVILSPLIALVLLIAWGVHTYKRRKGRE